MAVQPFSLPIDSLFSSFTAPPAPPAIAEQTPSRRLSGVGRTVIAIAATSVFFGGAGSLYMHAAMGHMSMSGNSTSMQQPAVAPPVSAPGAATMVAPAPAMPGTTGSDAAPPRALGNGMPMPATAAAAPMPAAPMPAAAMPAAPKATTPVQQSSPTTSRTSTAGSSSASAASAPSTVRRYTVGEGDSFSTFAARYGVSEARIAALNPGVDSTGLTIGQTLRVR